MAASRLAELAVQLGANVQPGQIVTVKASLGQEQLARAVAEHAYRRHARFVDVDYFDPFLKRVRLAHADLETLDFVPSWYGERIRQLGVQRCARISFTGAPAPGILDDLDASRVGKDQLPYVKEIHEIVNERTTNWTVVPGPHLAWAQLVHPQLPPDEALTQLWQEVMHVLRLDTDDPIQAWEDRMADLRTSAERLSARHFAAIQLEGPGTNVTVGLLPTSRWLAASSLTMDGIRHVANLPTEEVFTTPDPTRTEGVVSATRPLVLRDGTIVENLRVRFEGGRAVQVEATRGVDTLRGVLALDENVARLGELALVDRQGRVGSMDTVFYDTLLDENAASHLALGSGYLEGVEAEDVERVNQSGVHLDFMVGSPEVEATGITSEGARVPVMRSGDWV